MFARKFKYMTLIITLLGFSAAAYAGMWMLVSSQIISGKFYCTYRLSGSNPPIEQTIVSVQSCSPVISE
jgi:hypothetical protein